MKFEVYVDGKYAGQNVDYAIFSLIQRFLEKLIDPKKGRNLLAEMLALKIRSEFTRKGMVFTGELTGSVVVNDGKIIFYAPHAWKWAEGHSGRAVRGRGGLFYEQASDPYTLTAWVHRKAPQLSNSQFFPIDIPQKRGFKKDAFAETIDKKIDNLLRVWVDTLAREDVYYAVGGR